MLSFMRNGAFWYGVFLTILIQMGVVLLVLFEAREVYVWVPRKGDKVFQFNTHIATICDGACGERPKWVNPVRYKK